MSNLSAAEKIETIVDCYLKSGLEAGAFGTLYPNPDGIEGWYNVTVEGGHFVVKRCELGWMVRCVNSGFEGVDADLYWAARLAIKG